MGRRARARDRAADQVTDRAATGRRGGDGRPGGAAGQQRRVRRPSAAGVARALSPIKPATMQQRRTRAKRFALACAAFGALLTVVGLGTGRGGWQPIAIMLALLAAVWGGYAVLLR